MITSYDENSRGDGLTQQEMINDAPNAEQFNIFFNRSDISNIYQNNADCVGIRFYFGTRDNGDTTLIAIGVKSNVDEIASTDLTIRDYIRSEGTMPSTPMNIQEAAANGKKPCAFFSRADLDGILTVQNCIGVRFRPGTHEEMINGTMRSFDTLIAVGVGTNMADLQVHPEGKDYVKSKLPCPPACGGTNYLGVSNLNDFVDFFE